MGMRIHPPGTTAATASTGSATRSQQRQQDFQAIQTALSSGDLGGAQKAFDALGKKLGEIPVDSPVGQLGQALKSGDVDLAKQVALALTTGRGGGLAGGPTSSGLAAGDNPGNPPAGLGSVINLQA